MRTHCVLRNIYLGTILDIFRTYYVGFVHKYDTSTALASLMGCLVDAMAVGQEEMACAAWVCYRYDVCGGEMKIGGVVTSVQVTTATIKMSAPTPSFFATLRSTHVVVTGCLVFVARGFVGASRAAVGGADLVAV